MSKFYWISCKCQVCEGEFEFEGSYEDAREKQKEFEKEHFHSGYYRLEVCHAEKDASVHSQQKKVEETADALESVSQHNPGREHDD